MKSREKKNPETKALISPWCTQEHSRVCSHEVKLSHRHWEQQLIKEVTLGQAGQGHAAESRGLADRMHLLPAGT